MKERKEKNNMTYDNVRDPLICLFIVTLLLSQSELFASAKDSEGYTFGLTLNYSFGGPPGKESGKFTLLPSVQLPKGFTVSGSLELPGVDFTLSLQKAVKLGASSTGTLGFGLQPSLGKWQMSGDFDYTIKMNDAKFPYLGDVHAKLHIDTKGNTDSTTSSAYLNIDKVKIAGLDVYWGKQKVNIDVVPQLQHYWKILGHIIFGAESGNQSYTGEISGNLTTDAPVPQTTISTNATYVVNQSDPSIMNFTGETTEYSAVGVGGYSVLIVKPKPDLPASYIGFASTIMVATVATAVYVKRVKRRKEK